MNMTSLFIEDLTFCLSFALCFVFWRERDMNFVFFFKRHELSSIWRISTLYDYYTEHQKDANSSGQMSCEDLQKIYQYRDRFSKITQFCKVEWSYSSNSQPATFWFGRDPWEVEPTGELQRTSSIWVRFWGLWGWVPGAGVGWACQIDTAVSVHRGRERKDISRDS